MEKHKNTFVRNVETQPNELTEGVVGKRNIELEKFVASDLNAARSVGLFVADPSNNCVAQIGESILKREHGT